MSVYISGVEMPKEHPLYIMLRPDGSVHVWDSYNGEGYGTQAIPVPEFSDIGFDSDDVWKKIFALVVLLLSDREKFDKLKNDMLADMEETE